MSTNDVNGPYWAPLTILLVLVNSRVDIMKERVYISLNLVKMSTNDVNGPYWTQLTISIVLVI